MTNSAPTARFAMIAGNPPRLVVRDRAELAKEDWGPYATRPWVHMADPHAAIEKALWCYERGMVPVVTERDPSFAAALGQRYQANMLMTDEASLVALAPFIRECASLHTVVVFGAHSAGLEGLVAGKEMRYIEA